jgi:hypothetical protein
LQCLGPAKRREDALRSHEVDIKHDHKEDQAVSQVDQADPGTVPLNHPAAQCQAKPECKGEQYR